MLEVGFVDGLGGIQEANSYVRINLSLFGLYPKRHVPTIPVELALVPGGLIYEMSSWTRAIVMPLSIIQAKTDTRPVPAGFDLDELVVPGKTFKLPKRDRLSALFRQLDVALKVWESRGPEMIRKPAIREAEKWILDHTRNSAGLGAIFPSMMYLVMALDALGYPRDHPDLIEGIRQFEGLLTETPDTFYFQPCVSPVWDTGIAMFALGEMGAVAPAPMRRAADWLIAREIRRRGDWSVKRPDLEPSGWGSRFPVLMQHPDSDGAWPPAEAVGLEQELLAIRDGLARLAPVPFAAGWQQEVARQVGLRPASLLECFIDVDGEPLVERLIASPNSATAIWLGRNFSCGSRVRLPISRTLL